MKPKIKFSVAPIPPPVGTPGGRVTKYSELWIALCQLEPGASVVIPGDLNEPKSQARNVFAAFIRRAREVGAKLRARKSEAGTHMWLEKREEASDVQA